MAWALALAVDVAVSTDWPMAVAIEAMNLAAVTHGATEDMDSLASTKKLLKVDAFGKSPDMFGLILFISFPKHPSYFPQDKLITIYKCLNCFYEYLVTFQLETHHLNAYLICITILA